MLLDCFCQQLKSEIQLLQHWTCWSQPDNAPVCSPCQSDCLEHCQLTRVLNRLSCFPNSESCPFSLFCFVDWWTALSFRTVASTIGKPVYYSSSFIAAGFPIQNMLSTFENLLHHFLIVSDVMVGLGEEVTYFAAMVSSRISKSCSKKGNSAGLNFKPNPTTPNGLLMWLDFACLA